MLAFSILGEKQEAAAAVESGTKLASSSSSSSLESGRSYEDQVVYIACKNEKKKADLNAHQSPFSSSSSRISGRERQFLQKLIDQFVTNSGTAFYLLTGGAFTCLYSDLVLASELI